VDLHAAIAGAGGALGAPVGRRAQTATGNWTLPPGVNIICWLRGRPAAGAPSRGVKSILAKRGEVAPVSTGGSPSYLLVSERHPLALLARVGLARYGGGLPPSNLAPTANHASRVSGRTEAGLGGASDDCDLLGGQHRIGRRALVGADRRARSPRLRRQGRLLDAGAEHGKDRLDHSGLVTDSPELLVHFG